jgi:hypothetical protein
MIDSSYLYKCAHCSKRFMKEKAFMAHTCTAMERSREIQTLAGQQSYILYKHWMEKRRYKPPPVETFITSTYYTSFYKFAQYCKETNIADPELYVELMVKQNISPALWRSSDAYNMYIEHLEKKVDPFAQAETTILFLEGLSQKLNVPLDKVFDELKFGELMELLSQRRLSPWILFCSTKFKARVSKFDEEERRLFYKAIGINYWAAKLEKETAVVSEMKKLTAGIGL